MTYSNSFGIKILLVYDCDEQSGAVCRAVDNLVQQLEKQDVQVVRSDYTEDARALIVSDPTIQCILLNYDDTQNGYRTDIAELLSDLRKHNTDIPVFLMTNRTKASAIETDILNKVSDFIWILEDTPDFIAGRIIAATNIYRSYILPPMFRALMDFSKVHEYSWHTPGHTGGTAFLKSAAGRAFFDYFKEPVFRSDLSISVGELGSLLDHSGPIGDSEKYMAHVFGADRSYHVTNGTSTSNRIVLMSSLTRNQVALCDRNCHKSVEHAMTMSGAVPTYLIPTRNRYGIIGPIPPERLTPKAIQKTLTDNPLITKKINSKPVHATITNSTYDGLCYNVRRVSELIGPSVDRLHFDEAWYGYARFNPIYQDRFAMYGEAKDYDKSGPTIFATQSTHKLLAAFSQASMIHIRDGKNPIDHMRFNEAFMMHASTSPFYPIIASNDVSVAMMDKVGISLTEDAIKEAVSFRQTVGRLNREFTAKHDWFFNVWQPDSVISKKTGKKVPFFEADSTQLMTDPDCWVLKPNDSWHGFGEIEEGYCMLDPIKVSITTPGMQLDGTLADTGIPAAVLSAYLDAKGIVVEKTTDFTVLLLFSIGITRGKWGTLLNALFEFKHDYDTNAPLFTTLPDIRQNWPERYRGMGLKDLCDEMYQSMKQLQTTKAMADAFSELPHPDMTPVEAYEQLVLNNVELLTLDKMASRTVATGVVPYPPGIPMLMPGENVGHENSAGLRYLKALEQFDSRFPGFTHDTHGVDVIDGKYHVLCLKKNKK